MQARAEGVLVSQLGYGTGSAAAVIAVVPAGSTPTADLITEPGHAAVPLQPGSVESVPGWTAGPYSRIPLPADLPPGSYRVRVVADGNKSCSEPFGIGPSRLQQQTMSDVLTYFKAMRSSGEIDRKDRAALRWDDDAGRTVDARGGWLDASGDTSKFLSHLTYTSTMSPQQIPLCAWAMMAARDAVTVLHPELVQVVSTRLRDEALFGADFLMRFRAPEGYFYTGIFDALTKELEERVVTAPLQDSVRTSRYQAGYRQGGGLAIAALARASTLDDDGDFNRDEYLDAAIQGFLHLEEHNLAYLFDGEESVIDDYCALLAATELVMAGYDGAREAADRRAGQLVARYEDGRFTADSAGRPFFHAAEAGLPILALLRYGSAQAREVAVRAMLDLLDRTAAVPNPFGYPRQLVQPTGGEPRAAFFFPHANETGYWWQGENATIASLSAAASACARLDQVSPADRERLLAFADDQLAWILGRNPFDACMLHGRGRNNPHYSAILPNFPGGIANGITSGWTDEDDLALLPGDAPEGNTWRWAEQWIPHTGWYLLAVASAR